MRDRCRIRGGLALLGVIAVVLFLAACEGQENGATVIEMVNRVDAHPRAQDDWQPAVIKMIIYGGGQVRTGTDSSARLEMLEGMVRLSADSIFTVKESITRQGKLLTTLFLQEGRLWASLTTDQPHEFVVETGNAVAAVRDTRFSVWTTEGQTLVSVAEGEVELTAEGQSVTVVAEQQTIVEQGQPPRPPEPMSSRERELWATEGEMPTLAPPTSTPTMTPTLTATPTPSMTATPTATFTPWPTITPTPTDTPVPSPTAILPTATPSPTGTPVSQPPAFTSVAGSWLFVVDWQEEEPYQFEITFKEDGTLAYRKGDSTSGGAWEQTSNSISFDVNDYSFWEGTIEGGSMTGQVSNRGGLTGSWSAERQ